ncbi:AAA ATPase-like protein [Pseudomonas helmanticensis]|uniref:AAA ATPase-like protein n=2 Tax=Pseudomonas helmanticensis TaxID=1471381 RepID=A0A4R7USL9_9PSED|nr:AAA ATPase-like protein [Pseudomonas helmanticensis]
MPPPVLAGRERLRERVRVGIARLRVGRSAKSVLMVGEHGVGKSVLLQQMCIDAEVDGVYTLYIADPVRRSLPDLLAPQLRLMLMRICQIEAAKDIAELALSALTDLVSAPEIRFSDLMEDLDFKTEVTGLTDQADLQGGFTTLLEIVGMAAKLANSALVLYIDELHCIEEMLLSSLIVILHRCAQSRLPVMLIGAGLPQLRARAGSAKSYAERLFDYPQIGRLSQLEAALAIVQPANAQGVVIEAEAVELIVEKTKGYPYFLQEVASHAWAVASTSPITVADMEKALSEAIVSLDERFFRGRFDRLTSMEKKYLRAMADLEPRPHCSSIIAERQGRRVQIVASIRDSLIAKGMIWCPRHGETAFTMPFFDEFLKRIMPCDDGSLIR